MKTFKLVMPKNETLCDEVLEKIITLFYDPENQGEFYCFKNKGNILISNDHNDFFNGELGKEEFPDWINNEYIMAYDTEIHQWLKICFSHIGLTAFYSIAGNAYQLIAKLNYDYLGEDIINSLAIDYANIGEYDISHIPGIGLIKEFDT